MPSRFPDALPASLPATLIRLVRRLPAPGDILVRTGTTVEPDDVIGRCSVQPDPVLLHVSAELGAEPRDLGRLVRHSVGARVGLRDVIARRRQHAVLAPMAGVLSDIDHATGFVALTPDPVPASVTAMLRGYVIAVDEGRSATIETPAATFQGVAGCGEEQWGALRVLVEQADEPLHEAKIDAKCAFAVLVGGAGITLPALETARREQVKAIILGSVDVEVLRGFWGRHWRTQWERMRCASGSAALLDDGPTLVVTEGFGQHAMNERLFERFRLFDGQEAFVDPTTSLLAPQQRPQIVVPLPYNTHDVEAARSTKGLRPGMSVRLLDDAHLGVTARLLNVQPQGRLRSGVRTPTATVELRGDESLVVPLSMLDVLE